MNKGNDSTCIRCAKIRRVKFLKIKLFVVIITIGLLSACREHPVRLNKIAASQVRIDSTLQPDDSLEAFIQPYRDHVNTTLDAPLAYAPRVLSKTDGKRSTSIGNMMADMLLARTDTLMARQGRPPVDFTVLNHGGIRSLISPGLVSRRTAYEIMPFENSIQVVSMHGKSIRDLVAFLITSDRPHPFAGMQIRLDADGSLSSVNIAGSPFDENREYRIATSSYLVQGGDDMGFFAAADSVYETGYSIRNALIDYFIQTDTLDATVDERFIEAGK